MKPTILLLVLLLSITALAAPTVHQVSLSWGQSTSPGVTGNCVYRSATAGGPYTQLTCAATPITTYSDFSISGGKTYFYVVTAVAGTQESAYSNEVQAIVPLEPGAPTNLTVTVK